MATERLSMRQTREILRQKWRLGRNHREVALSLGISCGAVGTTVLRARAAGLAWAQVEALADEALHARVYGPPTPPTRHRPLPDCAYLHAERRKPGVTLELLHLEYLEQHPDGYRYTQVCEVYRGRRSPGTRRRSKSPCKSRSGGSSPASGTRPSSPSPPSTPGSPSSSRISTRGRCGSTAPAAATFSNGWISPRSARCRRRPSSTASGRSLPVSTSTITSSSTAITTPSPTRSSTNTSTRA